MTPWWVSWYEPPRAGSTNRAAWQAADDARAWETGWRWCDGHVRCVAVVFAVDAAAARARVAELVGHDLEWRGQPVAMHARLPNNLRGSDEWWAQMTARAA